jgi:hypothetical protein
VKGVSGQDCAVLIAWKEKRQLTEANGDLKRNYPSVVLLSIKI